MSDDIDCTVIRKGEFMNKEKTIDSPHYGFTVQDYMAGIGESVSKRVGISDVIGGFIDGEINLSKDQVKQTLFVLATFGFHISKSVAIDPRTIGIADSYELMDAISSYKQEELTVAESYFIYRFEIAILHHKTISWDDLILLLLAGFEKRWKMKSYLTILSIMTKKMAVSDEGLFVDSLVTVLEGKGLYIYGDDFIEEGVA